ncbi:insulinase family protein [Moraxella nasovis]|uniref:insulinase family protein n=1 Tax=Moraxella nasovis TaxID=2904121 RepID=UPI001F611589|nr:insulinase family protein [Moraxella nasovis]UNU74062.1 insulinase family protein [Moraxella nasovis]
MINHTLHDSFAHIATHRLDALDIDVIIAKHKATGALHYHLATDNDENALMIGFATQPMTSRGEAHILEHVVLCGSEKYPVRDPFFSMIKRSLQTFMNAMTAADWTVYPFATQNKNDFFNLLSVYADAVFFPNIHALDFAQEGIRTELDDDGNLHYHGIVFNEMKGAMSGEIEQLYYALAQHVFATTTYHYNSGGDPKCIVDLTHDELVAFHQTHYHPTNAIIMSFGNIAVGEIEAKLHEDALSRFNDTEKPSRGKKLTSVKESRLAEPIRVFDTYTADEMGEKMTHHVMAWLLPTITDPKERLALRLMEGVLVEHAGSPLRAYLDSHPLGTSPSPLLGLDDSHYEMVFYAGLRGSEAAYADEVEQGILELLNTVANGKISDETIQTILHQIELDQRHIGGDSMPYGLTLMLEGFSTAIHGGNPVDVWQIDEHLTWLREQVKKPHWVQQLIRQHLIDNPHRVRLTLSPDVHKAKRQMDEERTKLDTLLSTLTKADKVKITEQTADLKARQNALDDVSILPKVGLSDIPSKISFVKDTIKPIIINGDSRTLHEYHAGTNGLYYYQVVTSLGDMADEILTNPLLPIYLTLLSELGTDKYNARDFQAVQAAHSSGVTARISQRTDLHNKDKMSSYFVVATRALNRKLEAIELVSDVLDGSIFSETDRMRELLQQKQSSWQSRLSGAGHAYAMQTASRNMSRLAKIEYAFSGLPALGALKSFLKSAKDNDDAWQALSERLANLHAQITSLPKDVVLVCESEMVDVLTTKISETLKNTKPYTPNTAKKELPFDELAGILHNDGSEDIAWLISTNVYHNAAVYPATTSDHDDTPALMVLAPFMRNGYLHGAIREKGGAYGGGASFDSNSCAFRFYSYRDPNCAMTFEHFNQSIDWVLDGNHDDEKLEEAIMGIIAGMDKPASPAGEAVKSCFSDLHQRTQAWQQAFRAKILAVSIDDLKRVTKTYLKDKPYQRAVIAPMESADTVKALGFTVKTLG